MPYVIRIRCDQCDAVLQVPGQLAGKKVRCPRCRDVNKVPQVQVIDDQGALPEADGTGDTADQVSPRATRPVRPGDQSTPGPGSGSGSGRSRSPARAAAPAGSDPNPAAIDKNLDGVPDDERILLRVRAALLRAKPLYTALALLGLLLGAAGLVTFGLIHPHQAGLIASITLLAATSLVLGVWRIATLGNYVLITDRRVVRRLGLISRNVTEVLHENIQTVQVGQTAWERLLGIGTLGISSSGQDEIEITIRSVPRPMRLKSLIDAQRGR